MRTFFWTTLYVPYVHYSRNCMTQISSCSLFYFPDQEWLDELADPSNAPLLQEVYLPSHFRPGVESKLREVKRAHPDVLVAYRCRLIGPSGETTDTYFPYGQGVHVHRWRFP